MVCERVLELLVISYSYKTLFMGGRGNISFSFSVVMVCMMVEVGIYYTFGRF